MALRYREQVRVRVVRYATPRTSSKSNIHSYTPTQRSTKQLIDITVQILIAMEHNKDSDA